MKNKVFKVLACLLSPLALVSCGCNSKNVVELKDVKFEFAGEIKDESDKNKVIGAKYKACAKVKDKDGKEVEKCTDASEISALIKDLFGESSVADAEKFKNPKN